MIAVKAIIKHVLKTKLTGPVAEKRIFVGVELRKRDSPPPTPLPPAPHPSPCLLTLPAPNALPARNAAARNAP